MADQRAGRGQQGRRARCTKHRARIFTRHARAGRAIERPDDTGNPRDRERAEAKDRAGRGYAASARTMNRVMPMFGP